jgi:hypothetical protein
VDINSGSGITVSAVDDAPGDRVRYTVAQAGGALDDEIHLPVLLFTKGSNNNPDQTFTQYEGNLRVLTWKVLKSSQSQQPIHAQARIPNNFDPATAPSLELIFMINRDNAGVGGNVRLQTRLGYRDDGQDVPASPGGAFQQTIDTNFAVTEPAAGLIRVKKVTVPVAVAPAIPAGGWLYVVLDRVAPAPTEYDSQIYYSVGSFKFRKV